MPRFAAVVLDNSTKALVHIGTAGTPIFSIVMQ
jgi:hypothetical protein